MPCVSDHKWLLLPTTVQPQYTYTNAGNPSIPWTGAPSATTVRMTAHATGCCTSTGTIRVAAGRGQSWTGEHPSPPCHQAVLTCSQESVRPLPRWTCYRKKVL